MRRFRWLPACAALMALTPALTAADPPRPNILWVTCEDINPHLGAYGDAYATTPNLDRLAARGLRYLHAWSNAPVCAPARTTLITGLYATSTGSEHMRSLTRLPAGMKMFPQYLREAGYYCTNNSKEDYNLDKPGQVWDESSAKGHWKNRAAGQPFFAVFNLLITHESQIRKRPHTLVHDPAKAPLPAYHPDMPEVRHDWAQYYDNITTMDGQVGALLKELEDAGLADDTIVFFFSDHGSGMPRSKRFPYNSGLNVPLLVYVKDTVPAARDDLRRALADEAVAVRIVAAEALGRYGDEEDARQALAVLLELAPLKKNSVYVSLMALNALDALGQRAAPGLAVIKDAGQGSETVPQRLRDDVPKLVTAIAANLQR
jgi:arylsulfatase A-like enzyme